MNFVSEVLFGGVVDSIVRQVPKGYVKASFVVWSTERRSVSCVCSIRFITGGPLYK